MDTIYSSSIIIIKNNNNNKNSALKVTFTYHSICYFLWCYIFSRIVFSVLVKIISLELKFIQKKNTKGRKRISDYLFIFAESSNFSSLITLACKMLQQHELHWLNFQQLFLEYMIMHIIYIYKSILGFWEFKSWYVY